MNTTDKWQEGDDNDRYMSRKFMSHRSVFRRALAPHAREPSMKGNSSKAKQNLLFKI